MRYFFLLVFLSILPAVHAQTYYKDLPVNKATVNYEDHTVTAYLSPLKRLPSINTERLYYWYAANTINITQGGYSGKLLNGVYLDHYLNKNLKEQGNFKKGLKSGTWSKWSEDGTLTERFSWKRGEMTGMFSKYTDGKPSERGKLKRGQLQGKHIQYVTADSTVTTYYKSGKIHERKKIRIIPGFIKRLITRQPPVDESATE